MIFLQFGFVFLCDFLRFFYWFISLFTSYELFYVLFYLKIAFLNKKKHCLIFQFDGWKLERSTTHCLPLFFYFLKKLGTSDMLSALFPKINKLRAYEHKSNLLGPTSFELFFLFNFILLFNWYIFMCFFYLN